MNEPAPNRWVLYRFDKSRRLGLGCRALRSPQCFLLAAAAVFTLLVILLTLRGVAGPSTSRSAVSLPYFLQHADSIDIYYGSGGVSVALTFLGPSKNANMLRLLRKCTNFHTKPPKRRGTIHFTAGSIGGRVYVSSAALQPYEYIPETGELGFGSEWCNVPEEFRVWLNDLYKRTPKKDYQVTRYPGVIVVSEPQVHEPPLCLVQSLRSRVHALKTVPNESASKHQEALPQGAEGSEVQYAVGPQPANNSPRWKRLAVIMTRYIQQWPSSYVGATIHYRIRWKYDDGTYGPWSKAVSAKVLP